MRDFRNEMCFATRTHPQSRAHEGAGRRRGVPVSCALRAPWPWLRRPPLLTQTVRDFRLHVSASALRETAPPDPASKLSDFHLDRLGLTQTEYEAAVMLQVLVSAEWLPVRHEINNAADNSTLLYAAPPLPAHSDGRFALNLPYVCVSISYCRSTTPGSSFNGRLPARG